MVLRLNTWLAREGGARQSELVEFAKVTQPRISLALGDLTALIWSSAARPVGL